MNFRLFSSLFMSVCLMQSSTYGLTFLLPELFLAAGGTTADVGSVLGFTAVATLAVVLLLGKLTKRVGVMMPLALSGVLCTLSLTLFASAAEVSGTLYLAGVLLGLGWGMFYVLGPIALAQILTPDRRVVQFTWLSASIMIGIGSGPIIGYLIGVRAAYYFVAVLCLICSAVFVSLASSQAVLRVADAAVEDDLSLRSALRVFRSLAWRPIVMVGLGASVFAAVSNFQTVYAEESGLNYATFFLFYTATVIIGRLAMARFIGSRAPYGLIAVLMVVMTVAVLILLAQSSNVLTYILAAVLFGIGYGIAYPIVKAMAANDARPELVAATLQLFGLSYFIGIFGFPVIAGVLLSRTGIAGLLILAAALAALEGLLAFGRWRRDLPILGPTSSKHASERDYP